jgi:beta-lactamase regulating signal transducer with metallopeptidase domain
MAWSEIAAGLLRTFLYGAPLVAVTYAIIRFVPGVPLAARVAAWWLVTARLVLWLVPLPAIEIPVLPAKPSREAATVAHVPISRRIDAPAKAVRALSRTAAVTTVSPSGAIAVAWTCGLSVLGAIGAMRSRRVTRMVREALPADSGAGARAAQIAARLGITTAFDVRVSPHVRTPQVVGLRRPVVLLPAERLASLDREELDMVLCHELVHVRHRDLWLGVVPAAARWLLFFNPLAHVAAREYALAREAACDARVLEVLDIAPRRYGALLLSFAAASRPALVGSAAATGSFSTLSRRLMMLDKTHVRPLRRAALAAPACAVFALLPLAPVARTVPLDSRIAQVPVAAAVPARAARAPQSDTPAVDARHAVPAHDTLDRTSWVLFKEGDDSVHMNGNTSDVHAARAARRGREALLWLRHDGREYVVRDAATIGRVREAFEPVEKLGRQQAEIGAKQAAIGARQAEVGQKQAEIGAKQAAIGTRQAAIGAKQAAAAALSSDAAREAQLQGLDAQMESLGREMEALGRDMEKLSKPMEDLSKEMEPLSKEQEKLGEEMESLVEQANADLEKIVVDAISKGTAMPVR